MFLYTAKMFLPYWLWANPEFKQSIQYSKKHQVPAVANHYVTMQNKGRPNDRFDL